MKMFKDTDCLVMMYGRVRILAIQYYWRLDSDLCSIQTTTLHLTMRMERYIYELFCAQNSKPAAMFLRHKALETTLSLVLDAGESWFQ